MNLRLKILPRKWIWSWKFYQIFFGIFGIFRCFKIFFLIFFYRFLVIFQRLPRISRPMGFGRQNSSGPESCSSPESIFKLCFSSQNSFQSHFWPPLSFFLKSSLSNPLFFPSFTTKSLKTSSFSSSLFSSQKLQFLLNPNCIIIQSVDHGTQGRFKEERKWAYSRGFTSPFPLFWVSLSWSLQKVFN